MGITENTNSVGEFLISLSKLMEKMYEHWFRELVFFSVMALIVFSTQACIVSPELLSNKFNLFIFLIVIGFSAYWYLLSNFVAYFFLISVFLNGKPESINAVLPFYNLLGLIFGSVCVVIPSFIVFALQLFFPPHPAYHLGVFFFAHLLIIYSGKGVFQLLASQLKKKAFYTK